jgi:hypothetical protein
MQRKDDTTVLDNRREKLTRWAVALAATSALLGCASIRNAQPKTVEIDGQRYVFGGSYDPAGTDLTITVNGDPLLRGSFPPYTPTLRLASKYKESEVIAQCYFSSVLSSRGGVVGIVAGAVQSGVGKSADKCDMSVNGKPAQEIYF